MMARIGRPARPELFAALDLGTNNCRLLVARRRDNGFQVIDSFSRAVRLGENIGATGELCPQAIRRAMIALTVCAEKMRRHRVRRVRGVATEACRQASNGRAFLDKVRRETGIRLDLITAEEEARLAVAGCAPLLDEAAEELLVLDIGGGSTELIWIDFDGAPAHLRGRLLQALAPRRGGMRDPDDRSRAAASHIVDWISAPAGVATLHERFAELSDPQARFEAMTAHFAEMIQGFAPKNRDSGLRGIQLIGASGTVTTLAGAHLGLTRYDRRLVDGLWIDTDAIRRLVRELVALSDSARAGHSCIGADRSLLIVAGAAILEALFRLWPVRRMRVADRGLREGILYALMSDAAEARR